MRLRCCHTLALTVGLVLGLPCSALADRSFAHGDRTSAQVRRATTGKKATQSAAKPLARGRKSASIASRRPAVKPRKRPKWAPVELFHVNRREALQLRMADSRGRTIKGNQKRLDKFFRCHHTNNQHRMDPRLVRLIYEVGRHYDGKRVEVVSGYRDPGVAKNPKSPHKQGLACDFRVIGVANHDLRDYLRKTYDHVGVGYYPNSSFVHLDVRKGSSAFWIDYSAPGGNSLYAENPADDLRSGRAETFKPTTIDPAWAKEGETTGDGDDVSGAKEGAGQAAPAQAAVLPPAPSGPP